jgi:hypothetical protein
MGAIVFDGMITIAERRLKAKYPEKIEEIRTT